MQLNIVFFSNFLMYFKRVLLAFQTQIIQDYMDESTP